MSSPAFAAAADAWRALLADSHHLSFLQRHCDAVMAMAVALAQPQHAENAIDWHAVREQFTTDEEEQALLALVFAIQDVVEVIVRENMVFLIDDDAHAAASESDASAEPPTVSASQRDAAAQQAALAQRLPEQFRLALLTTLRTHWAALRASGTDNGLRLNRLAHMSWRLARPYVLLRLVTSDHRQRIFKVSMAQFHQLRYSTAKVLQEMHQVEAHPIMRLTTLEQQQQQAKPPPRTGSMTQGSVP